MPGDDATIIARVSKSVKRELDQIATETKRTPSDLIREAVIAFIGMYRNARKK